MTDLKVGERVLVEGLVEEIGKDYVKIDFGLSINLYVPLEKISKADEPKFKFSLFDKVIYLGSPEYGVGEIIETDPYETYGLTYRVKFSDGHKTWLPENKLVLAYPNKPKE